MAALADGAARRFVEQFVLRPRGPRIVGECAVETLAAGSAIVEPCGGDMPVGIGCHSVEPFARSLRLVVDDRRLRPRTAAIGGTPVEQIAFGGDGADDHGIAVDDWARTARPVPGEEREGQLETASV